MASRLPPGFRFHPTDEELVAYYLKKRVINSQIEFDVIPDHDLYKCEPWDLPAKSRLPSWDSEWFFFSPRDRKYPNGSRTNRATEAGYWKATGRDRTVRTGEKAIGMKKTLVFYKGRAPHGERTDWLMHEYRLDGDKWEKTNLVQDGYVLCRVFKKNGFGPPLQPSWDVPTDEVGGEKEKQTKWNLTTDEAGGEKEDSYNGDASSGVFNDIPANESQQNPSDGLQSSTQPGAQLGLMVESNDVNYQNGFENGNKQYLSTVGVAPASPFLQYRPPPVKGEEGTILYQLISPPTGSGWSLGNAPESVEVKQEEVPMLSEDENSLFKMSPDGAWDYNMRQTFLDYSRGDDILPSGDLAYFNRTWLDEQQQGAEVSSVFSQLQKSTDFLSMLPPVAEGETEYWNDFDLPQLEDATSSPNQATECTSDVPDYESCSTIQIRSRQNTPMTEQSWEWTANPRRKHVKRTSVGDEVARGTGLDSSPVSPASATKVVDDDVTGNTIKDFASGLSETEESTQSNSWAAEMIVLPTSETSATEEKDIIVETLSPENISKELLSPASPVHTDVLNSSPVELDSHSPPATPRLLPEDLNSSQPKSDKIASSVHPVDGQLSIVTSEDIVSGSDEKLSKTDNVSPEAYVGGLLQLIVQPILATAAASYSSSDAQRAKLQGTTTSIGSMRVNVVTITACACQRDVDKKLVQPTLFNCFCYPDSQQIYDSGEKIRKEGVAVTKGKSASVGVEESITANGEVVGKGGEASNMKVFVLIFLLGVFSASAFFVLSKFCKHAQNDVYLTSSSA